MTTELSGAPNKLPLKNMIIISDNRVVEIQEWTWQNKNPFCNLTISRNSQNIFTIAIDNPEHKGQFAIGSIDVVSALIYESYRERYLSLLKLENLTPTTIHALGFDGYEITFS